MKTNINVEISSDLEDKAWDDFLVRNNGHHVQSSFWAQVKAELGWKARRVKIFESGEIVAGAQIMIKKLSPFVSIGYVPKGPVGSSTHNAECALILRELVKLSKSEGIRLIAVQPPQFNEDMDDHYNALGFGKSWLELVPTATIYIDLTASEKGLLSQMKRQTRQNINRSFREGIQIREGGPDDICTFYRNHLETSRRQNFKPYPQEYFEKMWEVMANHGSLVAIIAEFENETVSSLLIVPFGNTVIAKVLGWSGNFPEKRPNDAAFWGAICWASNHNYEWFDMGGIRRQSAEAILAGSSLPDESRSSPDFFKLGFGGQIKLMPQSYDYVPGKSLNKLYHKFFDNDDRKESFYSAFDRVRRRIG